MAAPRFKITSVQIITAVAVLGSLVILGYMFLRQPASIITSVEDVDHLMNGDFETGYLAPWTSTYGYNVGAGFRLEGAPSDTTYGCRVSSGDTPSKPGNIQQKILVPVSIIDRIIFTRWSMSADLYVVLTYDNGSVQEFLFNMNDYQKNEVIYSTALLCCERIITNIKFETRASGQIWTLVDEIFINYVDNWEDIVEPPTAPTEEGEAAVPFIPISLVLVALILPIIVRKRNAKIGEER